MPWVDYVIIGIVGVSALLSLIRGFVREAVSLIGWILAVWAAITFGTFVAALAFSNYIESESLRLVAGYVSVFLVVLIAVGMINLFIGMLVDKTGLSSTDRVLGMVFGGGRGAVIVAVLVVLAGTTAMPRETWWRSSNLIPYFEVLGGELRKLLPAEFGDRWRGV